MFGLYAVSRSKMAINYLCNFCYFALLALDISHANILFQYYEAFSSKKNKNKICMITYDVLYRSLMPVVM